MSEGPILLVTRDTIPAETSNELSRLSPESIVVLGSEGVVSADVQDQLTEYTSGAVYRVEGVDRYDTALSLSQSIFDTAEYVFVATGESFPDALAGGPLAGALHAPVLLVNGAASSVPADIRDEILRLAPSLVIILGGEGVVSREIEEELRALGTP